MRPEGGRVRRRVSELEAKFLLFALFIMGGLAVWAGSDAVPPAHVIGMVLAGTVGNDHVLKPDVLVKRVGELLQPPIAAR
jgi:hypothetical protein